MLSIYFQQTVIQSQNYNYTRNIISHFAALYHLQNDTPTTSPSQKMSISTYRAALLKVALMSPPNLLPPSITAVQIIFLFCPNSCALSISQ